ncbi:MAG TPA: hypothetical protein VFU88_11820 [Ktedonobacterales bacterium]|nr:hypothetical protein [Ktedonobacterales bacterium]
MTSGASGVPERGQQSGGLSRGGRPLAVPDTLYGNVRVAPWAAALLAAPLFRRLAGVSLSDVPGELLFGHPFPSRLDHAIGVYGLARVARPRDRALHAAALAHDLGHGPLSHLTELLMRECLGMDHEQRSAHLLQAVRASLPADVHDRFLSWLDWDEVASLLLGAGRGALLNGQLDYDNADNVARFLLASGLGTPEYDPQALAAGLRLSRAAMGGGDDVAHGRGRVYLEPEAEAEARAWQRDRVRVYEYLHAGHRNLALHAMLRKAVDLGAATGILPESFFSMTDLQALRLLEGSLDRGLSALVRLARAGREYACVWQLPIPEPPPALTGLFASWRQRLNLESQLAAEAALAPHDVIADLLASSAIRPLPPVGPPSGPLRLTENELPYASPAAPTLRLFAPSETGRDYLRRLGIAAERLFGSFGVMSHVADLQATAAE